MTSTGKTGTVWMKAKLPAAPINAEDLARAAAINTITRATPPTFSGRAKITRISSEAFLAVVVQAGVEAQIQGKDRTRMEKFPSHSKKPTTVWQKFSMSTMKISASP